MMPEMFDTITRLLRVHGRVQGVYYRASTVQQAERLGVSGWVRNRADGSVEALVQGAPDAVQALIDWAHQGPPHAQVERVEVSDAPAEALVGFTQADTV